MRSYKEKKLRKLMTRLTDEQLDRVCEINEDNYDWVYFTPDEGAQCLAGHAFDLGLGKRFANLPAEDQPFAKKLSRASNLASAEDIRRLAQEEHDRRQAEVEIPTQKETEA